MNKLELEEQIGIGLILSFVMGLSLVGMIEKPEPIIVPLEAEQKEPLFPQEERNAYIQEYNEFLKREISCLALNMYFEARGEDRDGQDAVAFVTLNRVMSTRYPNTVCEVVYQAKTTASGFPIRNQCQFSWYCDGRPDVAVESVYREIEVRAEYIYVNYYLNSNYIDDTTGGSTHYHATHVEPFWSKHENYQEVASIGDHVFYRPTY